MLLGRKNDTSLLVSLTKLRYQSSLVDEINIPSKNLFLGRQNPNWPN